MITLEVLAGELPESNEAAHAAPLLGLLKSTWDKLQSVGRDAQKLTGVAAAFDDCREQAWEALHTGPWHSVGTVRASADARCPFLRCVSRVW
jgi:hypothetical protein